MVGTAHEKARRLIPGGPPVETFTACPADISLDNNPGLALLAHGTAALHRHRHHARRDATSRARVWPGATSWSKEHATPTAAPPRPHRSDGSHLRARVARWTECRRSLPRSDRAAARHRSTTGMSPCRAPVTRSRAAQIPSATRLANPTRDPWGRCSAPALSDVVSAY